jgi:hypothetical protein
LSDDLLVDLRHTLREVPAEELPTGSQIATIRDDPAFYRRLKSGLLLNRSPKGSKPFKDTGPDVIQIGASQTAREDARATHASGDAAGKPRGRARTKRSAGLPFSKCDVQRPRPITTGNGALFASSGVDAIVLRDRCLLKQDGVRTDCPCENTSTEERAILTAVPGARISIGKPGFLTHEDTVTPVRPWPGIWWR